LPNTNGIPCSPHSRQVGAPGAGADAATQAAYATTRSGTPSGNGRPTPARRPGRHRTHHPTSVTLDGERRILGLRAGEHGDGEGTGFWRPCVAPGYSKRGRSATAARCRHRAGKDRVGAAGHQSAFPVRVVCLTARKRDPHSQARALTGSRSARCVHCGPLSTTQANRAAQEGRTLPLADGVGRLLMDFVPPAGPLVDLHVGVFRSGIHHALAG
jgi:hypothetical protein